MDDLLNIINLHNLLGNNRQMRVCDERYGDFFLRAKEGDKNVLPDFVTDYQINDGYINMIISSDALLQDVGDIANKNCVLGIHNDMNTLFNARLYFELDNAIDEITTMAAHRLAVNIVDVYRLFKLGYKFDKRFLDLLECYDICFHEGTLWQSAIKTLANYTKELS